MAPSIDILMNAREVQRGARDVAKALDEVADAADDAARDGEKGTDKLERGLRDIVQAARPAERAYKDVGDEAKDAGRKAKDAGDDADRGLRKMGAAGEEVSGELRQNLGETFSSFRGDLEDFGQIGQDVFGGLASSASSLTGALGLSAVAGAVGLVIGGLIQAREEQERNTEQANEWAQAYMEAGGRILSTTTIVAKGQRILQDDMDTLKANTEAWGVSQETALAAMSGSPAAIEEVRASIEAMTAEMERQQKIEMKDEWAEYSSELTALQGRVYDGSAAFEQMTARMDEGAEKANAYSYFLRDVATTTEGATTAVDEFGDSVVTLPDGKQIYIDAETGQATDDVDAIERKVYSAVDGMNGRKVVVRVQADTSEFDRKMGDLQRRANNGQAVVVPVRMGNVYQ